MVLVGPEETMTEDLLIHIRFQTCLQYCDFRLGNGNDVGATDARSSQKN
jgi:hypothetical protein